jgi:galactonate dehydratase
VNGEISKAGVRTAAEAIEKMRTAVGPDIEILIDFHGQYNVTSALRCITALEPYDITWFEEPMQPENTDALRQLRAQTDAPLCVGERLYTRWDFLPIFRDRLANYVMPDVCWTGGISELKKIATMAEAHAVPIAPHGALGAVQTVASAHVMLGVPNLYRLELLAPDWVELYNGCLQPGLDIRDGHLHLSDRPGLGIELDRDWIRAHTASKWV